MASSLYYLLLLHFCTIPITAVYTLTPSQSIADGQTLVSQGDRFELGFFSPVDSEKRYVGIWYKNIPVQTVVWVANRDSPLNNTSGVLKISSDGNLVIQANLTQNILWSSNSSSNEVQNPILEFLETGNIVVRDERITYWESFDYPSDTLLPGMKLGVDLRTGLDRYLSAWKSPSDPSHGDYTYGMNLKAYLESALRRRGNETYRGGPWNGVSHSGATDLRPNTIFTYEVVHNDEEIYFMYELVDQSVIMRLVLSQTSTEGRLQRYTWAENTHNWNLLVNIPRDRCDDYGLCGPYSTCDVANVAVCQCLEGFRPYSLEDWSSTDWSEGCVRETAVNCSQGEGFRLYTGVKLPDTTGSWVNTSMSLKECRVKCLNNCTCMAYANSDIRGGGSGCILWVSKLMDIRQLTSGGEDLYIRMAASELDSIANSRKKKRVILIVAVTLVVGGMILFGLGSWCIWKKRHPKGRSEKADFELPLYELSTLTSATNNFAEENKLGEGGFGPVFKGTLEGGQEIAVKRLSKDSIQGTIEFKNEVILISKLQHRNLVRLLGCCIQGEEKMLVYEYMRNKSLDSTIFDETKSSLLDWKNRVQIILGIARGLLYLHHDSRLRIIHRDLKASNILLDCEMVPKISDFGMARLFGGDQNEAKTKRVVGTYGYMSPEYAIDGHFSVKSDVFSFGVLVLEIISGKKNRSFRHPDHDLNLLGHAWRLWNEERSMELVEDWMRNACIVKEVLRCIHVGLLCVQKRREERPTMPSVVLMLSSEAITLAKPQQPGFYIERSTHDSKDLTDHDRDYSISTEVTMTHVQGR